MNYFKYNEKEIEKYEVVFEKEQIQQFRNQVINDYSEIEHHEYDDALEPNYLDYMRIRNYNSYKIGVKNDFNYQPIEIYHFSYDEYKYPYLVTIIDKLLSDDITAIDELYNPNYELEKVPFNSQIKEATEIFNTISNLKIDEKKSQLEKLQNLIESAKINQNQKPIKDYYLKLQEMITFNHIDTLTIEEYDRVNKFFDKQNQSKTKKRI